MKYIAALFMILFLSVFLYYPVINSVSRYLSIEKKIPANILVVEGWIPEYALRKAYKEFITGDYEYIVTTGLVFPRHLAIFTNAYMIFHPHSVLISDSTSGKHKFLIHAESSLGDQDSCHFVFYVNNTAVQDFYTCDNDGRFIIHWEGKLPEIDSLMIQFDNDIINEYGDRNLRIKKFTLNHRNLIMENADVFLDRGNPFGKQRRNVTASSYAELAGNYFTDKGINPDRVIAVNNERKHLNRTYGNALALRDWLIENEIKSDGINIVSMEYHSRRTWLVYKKLIEPRFRVGIISVPDIFAMHFQKDKSSRILKESAALLYYYVFILPWI